MTSALITGIFGQDGSYLAEHLLDLGYNVYGIIRPGSFGQEMPHYLRDLSQRVTLFECDLTDLCKLQEILNKVEVDEVYHLAACHHASSIKTNEIMATKMIDVNFVTTKTILSHIINNGLQTKFFFAGSLQMYTAERKAHYINEQSPFCPSTFYGLTKVWSQQLVDYYRKEFGLFGVTGILFNHESPRRGKDFITQIISRSAYQIKQGKRDDLEVRKIHALVDWSSAKDFVRAMHLSLNVETPRDYIFSSGKVHSILDFAKIIFNFLGLEVEGRITSMDPSPSEKYLVGDPSLMHEKLNLGKSISFKEMAIEMVSAYRDSPKL